MNFKQVDIDRYLKTPDLNIKCVLIYGSNEGQISDYTKQFAQTACPDLNDAFRVVWLSMDAVEKDTGLLSAEYNARSLIGGRRVVIIKDADNNLTAHLKTLFTNTDSDTLIVASSTTLNKKSSLVSLATESPFFALISCYDDRDETIHSFVRTYLIKNGITISADAMQLLCARLSPDRKISTGELEKLITYLGTRHNIERTDIQNAISDASGSSTEDLCYAVASGETLKAIDFYQEILREGAEPVSLVRSLSYHFMRLLDCAIRLQKGASVREVIKAQRPPIMFFREDSFTRQVTLWKQDALMNALDILSRVERDCKTTNMPAETILSYALLQISGAARKLRQK